MKYIWRDYIPEGAEYIELWLDGEAVRMTGLDDGWKNFFEYWKNEDNITLNDNYWCKVVFDGDTPFGIVALSVWDESFNIMELLVDPKLRGQGRGSALLKELIEKGDKIIGKSINNAEAVIYPNNPASQKAFENAGFTFDHTSDEGDALYYVLKR